MVMRGATLHVDLPEPVKGIDVLKELSLPPDTAILLVDGKPVPYTDELKTPSIRIIRVASGG